MKKICLQCNEAFKKKYTSSKVYFARQKFCGLKCYGEYKKIHHRDIILRASKIACLPEHKIKQANSLRGKKRPLEVRLQLRIIHLKRVALGLHNNYKGGVSSLNEIIRKSLEYRLWREAIFKRDNFICQECNQIGGKLNAHHIKPFSLFPELRLAIDNGITLCELCHHKTDSWGRPFIKKESYVQNF